MKIYQGKISYLFPILIIPALFTIGVIVGKEFNSESITILCLAWIFFLGLLLLSLLYKLEIKGNSVRKIFLGFTMAEFSSDQVELINYGGMALWNQVYPSGTPIHGKGLAILVNIRGGRRTYGFSEKLYGEEAISHIEVALMVYQKQIL